MKKGVVLICFALSTACAGADEGGRTLDAESWAMLAPEAIRASCERYEEAFRRPEVRDRLERWFRTVPDVLDPKSLEQVPIRNPVRIGYVYTIPLGFDPAEIGLKPDARVEIRLADDGTVTEVSITDTINVMYDFKTRWQHEDYFRNTPSMRKPPGENVGVRCRLR